MIKIEYDAIVFQEGTAYVAYSPKLDVSSCGGTVDEAKSNLRTAVRLFLEEAAKMGTLEDILDEAGYTPKGEDRWMAPRVVATEVVELVAQ